MPKVVDRAQRQRDIADAVLRLVVAEGLRAASLRRVGAEAGLSMGTVQHYFRDHDEMLTFALNHMIDQRSLRVRTAIEALGAGANERHMLRTVADQVLPFTEQGRAESSITMAYAIRSLAHPATGELLAEGPPKVIGLFTMLMSQAKHAGRLAEGIDPTHEARVYWALLESLAQAIMVGYRTTEDASATLDYYLGRVFR